MSEGPDFLIRGPYPFIVGYEQAIAVGYAFAKVRGAIPGQNGLQIYLSGDRRETTPRLIDGVQLGLCAAGANVVRCGQGLMEQLTYFVGAHHGDGGIMVTADDAPDDWNGYKLIGPDARPLAPSELVEISNEVLAYKPELDEWVEAKSAPEVPDAIGYTEFLARCLEPFGDWPPEEHPYTVLLDPGDTPAASVFLGVAKRLNLPKNLRLITLKEVDGKPHTGMDPMDGDRLTRMRYCMQSMGASLGLAWGGDGCRIRVYPKGRSPVSGALLGSYMAAAIAQRYPGHPVLCDQDIVFPMVSTAVGLSFEPKIAMSGQAYMKNYMRNSSATFGAEAEGRYYFRDLWWSDSGILAAFLAMQMAYLTPKPFADLVSQMERNFPSLVREIPVSDPKQALAFLKATFEDDPEGMYAMSDTTGALILRSSNELDWRIVIREYDLTGGQPGLRVAIEGRGDTTLDTLKRMLGGVVADLENWYKEDAE